MEAELPAVWARAYRLAGRDADAKRAAVLARRRQGGRGFRDPFVDSAVREGVSYASLIGRAIQEAAAKNHRGALDLVNQALSARPEEVEAQVFCGVLLLQLDRPEEAAGWFDTVLDREPDHARALALKGRTFLALGDEVRGLQSLRASLAADASPR